MITVPRWLSMGTGCAVAIYSVNFAIATMVAGRFTPVAVVGFVLFVAAFLAGLTGRADRRPPLWCAIAVTVVGVLVPVFGMTGFDPATDTYSSGAWYVPAVVALANQLLWRRRLILSWVLVAGLVASTAAWGGTEALISFSVFAVVLDIAVVSAAGWALTLSQRELERYSVARRETIELAAAQDAYHMERQVRLATSAHLASPLLQRIVDQDGALSEVDRFECRVLGQTIRDEIRGRRLLNDAVREQVIAHRRRGAVVQVNDDGGLDDLGPEQLGPMLDQVAEAISGLQSDRIIIRTGGRDTTTALSVVAMSSDPIAAALGIDDGDDDRVDLWLELERPGVLERAGARA